MNFEGKNMSAQCANGVLQAIERSESFVRDGNILSRMDSLRRTMLRVTQDGRQVDISTIDGAATEILTMVLQSPVVSPDDGRSFFDIFQRCRDELLHLYMLSELAKPTIRGKDKLLDTPKHVTINPIHGDEDPINMFWQSAEMQSAWNRAMKISKQKEPVLIQAERGTGKELFARGMLNNSPRAQKPFVVVNTTALPKDLLESALGGHKRGSFTGAVSENQGIYGSANGGTVFFDEIGNAELQVQEKLLRTIEYGDSRKVGETNGGDHVDIRFIFATNRNLVQLSRNGKFLPDLLDRMQYTVPIPPLRERADLEATADHLLHARHAGREMSGACREKLRTYTWPGNVRELDSALKNAVLDKQVGKIEWDNIYPYLRYAA